MSVRTVAFDRLATSAPATRTAAVVTGRGVHWTPARTEAPGYRRSDVPLPVYPAPRDAPPIVGMRVDRLTVVGYGSQGTNGARWVVRCVCGAYEHRKAKFLMSESAKARARCLHCDYLEELKAGRA